MTDRYQDLRPLIVAEHASARFGGEAILPLHYFRFLRRRGIEAFMVVHERTRSELDELLHEDRDRIFYVPDTWLHLAAWRIGQRLPDAVETVTTSPIMHAATQYAERRLVKELVARVGATVVHEPIPVSPKAPSMTFDVGAPVVIGPMNGGMTYPRGFRHLVGAGRAAANIVNVLVPGKRKAAALLVANERTRRALPVGVASRAIELVENGVDLTMFRPPPANTAEVRRARPRFVFLGRLVAWKAVDLLLQAVAEARRGCDLELHVVGDGEERSRLEALSDKLGLAPHVTFHGFVPQTRCAPLLADADALVLPSLYECGGAVVLEAMAMGLPVIATRWGGPADYLDDTCGILTDPENPPQFVAALAAAMQRLARDPEGARALGRAGRARVIAKFDWERKIDRIIEIYREVSGAPTHPA
jgi:glycosyltransferase involved in cell wall biosynthesis